MSKVIYILFIILFCAKSFSQELISKEIAVKNAIENGIKEPLDSFIVILKNDTIWEVQSLFCDDYYGTKSETYSIHAITGEKLNLIGMSQSIKWHSHPRPRTEINYDFVDSLLKDDKKQAIQLLPDHFECESKPIISPDNKWIAFDCGFREIAIVSIDGDEYRKICDSCLFPQWTEKENILIYEKDFKKIYKHNIVTNEISPLTNNKDRYLYFTYCPTGKWISYVKSIPRVSDKPNVEIMCIEDDCYELFIKSTINRNEKRITYEGDVSSPTWNRSGDTIFFYLDRKPYYSTNFDLDKPVYCPASHLDKINIWDYSNKVGGKFVYKHDCQLMLVNTSNLKPEKYINKKRDRYENIVMSSDGKKIVYTIIKQDKEKIYIIDYE